MSEKPGSYFSAMERFPEHVSAIGMISIEIANLEIMLSLLLSHLLNVSGQLAHAVYFTPRANIARLEMITNVMSIVLAGDENKYLRNKIEKLISRTTTVMGKRHDTIHNSWGAFMDDVARISLPHQKDEGLKIVPITELTDLLRDIRELITRAGVIADEYPEATP